MVSVSLAEFFIQRAYAAGSPARANAKRTSATQGTGDVALRWAFQSRGSRNTRRKQVKRDEEAVGGHARIGPDRRKFTGGEPPRAESPPYVTQPEGHYTGDAERGG